MTHHQPNEQATPTSPRNTFSIIGIVAGVLALLLPIVFGPAGVILGVMARTRNERLGQPGAARGRDRDGRRPAGRLPRQRVPMTMAPAVADLGTSEILVILAVLLVPVVLLALLLLVVRSARRGGGS